MKKLYFDKKLIVQHLIEDAVESEIDNYKNFIDNFETIKEYTLLTRIDNEFIMEIIINNNGINKNFFFKKDEFCYKEPNYQLEFEF